MLAKTQNKNTKAQNKKSPTKLPTSELISHLSLRRKQLWRKKGVALWKKESSLLWLERALTSPLSLPLVKEETYLMKC